MNKITNSGCFTQGMIPWNKGKKCKSINVTHGLSTTSTYDIYNNMKARCNNVNCPEYKWYGALGIKICPEWSGKKGFINFYKDMGERPSKKHSLDRINGKENYSFKNCRWATWIEQQNNRKNTRFLTFNNKTQSLSNWAREIKISRELLYNRIYISKWSIEKSLTCNISKIR